MLSPPRGKRPVQRRPLNREAGASLRPAASFAEGWFIWKDEAKRAINSCFVIKCEGSVVGLLMGSTTCRIILKIEETSLVFLFNLRYNTAYMGSVYFFKVKRKRICNFERESCSPYPRSAGGKHSQRVLRNFWQVPKGESV